MAGRCVWDLLQESQDYLSTGCEGIDELLRGGFPVGLVSEICGSAGSGKTQLSLQLLLRAQLAQSKNGTTGLDASSCYMYSDGLSPLKRLNDLAGHTEYPVSLNRIFLEPATDPEQLLHVMKSRIPSLMQIHGVRVVIVDSIAAIFRGQSIQNVSDAVDRSKVMFEIVKSMKILANQFNAVFIVINQMSANMQNENIPSMGLAWASCINQRFIIHKVPREPSKRSFHVVFSPYLPQDIYATMEITQECLK